MTLLRNRRNEEIAETGPLQSNGDFGLSLRVALAVVILFGWSKNGAQTTIGWFFQVAEIRLGVPRNTPVSALFPVSTRHFNAIALTAPCRRYRTTDSGTLMLQQSCNLDILEVRRKKYRLNVLFQIMQDQIKLIGT